MKTKTKTNFPKSAELKRPDDYFLIMIPFHWARGKTLAEARANLRKNAGRDVGMHWVLYSVHSETTVNEWGGLSHLRTHPPIEIASSTTPVEKIINAHKEVYGDAPELFEKIRTYAASTPIPELTEQEAGDLLSAYGQAVTLVKRRPELAPLLKWLDHETGCDE